MGRSAFLARVLEATNAHDVERIVACRFYLEPVAGDELTADGFPATLDTGGAP